jgi:hypothetical protein
MKSIITASAIALALTIAGSSTGAAQEPGSCATPVPTDALARFEGVSADVTESLEVGEGLYSVTATYEGDGYFSVWAYDDTGHRELLFNGPENAGAGVSAALPVEGDAKLVFDVDADGPWTIEVRPAFD